jgi:5-methylcytosine-specific restriction endonuclease McrA
MPFKRCMACGELVRLEDWQPHRNAHRGNQSRGWSARHRGQQKAFRKAVLTRDGWACTFVFPSGLRCGVTEDLIAHHKIPLGKGGGFEPDNGVTLCRPHHREVDSHAR